jgi:phosphosulfolactate synthase (CoM biosynthesis protein A)
LTSVIDFGPDGFGWTGPAGVRDLMACAADYIDYVKIYALNALLLPEQTVTEIVRIYRDAGVIPYSGGILFEYAHQRGEIDAFVRHLEKIGIGAMEVSENYISLSEEKREAYIERFQKAGLSVIYEFGRKNPDEAIDLALLEKLVTRNMERGVKHTIIEQSEIDFAVQQAPERMAALAERNWFAGTLIEADPYRFPKQHVELIRQFGPEVSLANVGAAQALRLEGLRRGIGRAVDYSLLDR